jgi:hypothetical protein
MSALGVHKGGKRKESAKGSWYEGKEWTQRVYGGVSAKSSLWAADMIGKSSRESAESDKEPLWAADMSDKSH